MSHPPIATAAPGSLRRLGALALFGAVVATGCAGHLGAETDGGGGDDDDDGGTTDACPCPNPDGGGGGPDGGGGGPDGGGNTGCDNSTGVGQPFGNHAGHYAAGTILPSGSNAERDNAVRAFYDQWKANYVKQGCGAGRYYIASHTDGNRMTVSEAHGYGMLVTVYMAGHDPQARTVFDGMFHYFADHPSDITPSLMAWSQDSACHNNDGANSASDGDLDIAYALLLADKQWGSGGAINYRAEADRLIAGILDGEVDDGHSYVLLGDWVGGTFLDSTRTSDFMPTHLASFRAASGNAAWAQVRDRTYALVDTLQTGFAAQTGLLPDFVRSPTSGPSPAPAGFLEGANDGQYSYNACRDPWRIGVDFLVNGDARAKTIAQRLNTWIKTSTGGNPENIKPGYRLNGQSLGGNYLDTSFVAPFGVAAMVDVSNQAWLDSLWDTILANSDTGYYGDSIAMLSLIAMSGNWWSPEAAACP